MMSLLIGAYKGLIVIVSYLYETTQQQMIYRDEKCCIHDIDNYDISWLRIIRCYRWLSYHNHLSEKKTKIERKGNSAYIHQQCHND